MGILKNPIGKAICVAHSWFNSGGLAPVITGPDTIRVGDTNVVFQTTDKIDPLDTRIIADANKVSSISLAVTLKEIHRVTRLLGKGEPCVARPVSPGSSDQPHSTSRALSSDYEAIVMRFTQFSRSANPPPHIMRKYDAIVIREAKRVARRHAYRKVLRRMGMDWEDLASIGRIYFVNHYHNHSEKHGTGDINEKFLVHSLQQQFCRWYQVTYNTKFRNIQLSAYGVSVDQCMGSPVPGAKIGKDAINMPTMQIDEDFDEREAYLDDCNAELASKSKQKPKPHRRQQIAKTMLMSRLGAMPHDHMVEALGHVAASNNADFYAARLAAAMLKEHVGSCQACQPKPQTS